MPLSHLALLTGARGPAFNCLTACAASTQAIGEATEISWNAENNPPETTARLLIEHDGVVTAQDLPGLLGTVSHDLLPGERLV